MIDPDSFTLVTEPLVRIGPRERNAVYEALLYGRADRIAEHTPGKPEDPLRLAWAGYGSTTGAVFVQGFPESVLKETLETLVAAKVDPVVAGSDIATGEVEGAIAVVDYALRVANPNAGSVRLVEGKGDAP